MSPNFKYNKRLGLFVAEFQSTLGRSERVSACHAYLEGLLKCNSRGARTVASSGRDPHTMRQFVNRSPWSDDEVMRQLRSLVFRNNPKGVLVLMGLNLPKKGRRSVGTERQCAKPHPTVLGRKCETNCQSVILWCWVTPTSAWPIAARLYLPLSWELKSIRARRAGIPMKFQKYMSRSAIALDLLDNIKPELPDSCMIGVEEAFCSQWDLFAELDQRRFTYIAELAYEGVWPFAFDELHLIKPGQAWGMKQVYFQTLNQTNLMLSLLGNSTGDPEQTPLKHLPKTNNPAWRSILGYDRYIIQCLNKDQIFDFHLINKHDIAREQLIEMGRAFVKARELRQNLLTKGGLKKFEGRTWRGLHHHLTMCFMAHFLKTM